MSDIEPLEDAELRHENPAFQGTIVWQKIPAGILYLLSFS
jgi:hypothetical protein